MPLCVVILEDNEDRRAAMEECLSDRFAQYPRRYFATAAETIEHLRENLDNTLAIALDHDLEFIEQADGCLIDPGSGRDVVEYLVGRTASCPIVVHSSNSHAAIGMIERLREHDWSTRRVVPYDDVAWIPREWFRAMRDAIVGAVAGVAPGRGIRPRLK
ncbi:MAG: hypothetical protein IT428_19200 [Planctomycetaceae bacterium]|nr:hypothetical protein [Planctomycetaceae bacterium]